MADKKFVLTSPKGEKYETTSKVEATRLKAYGYTEAKPSAPVADKK